MGNTQQKMKLANAAMSGDTGQIASAAADALRGGGASQRITPPSDFASLKKALPQGIQGAYDQGRDALKMIMRNIPPDKQQDFAQLLTNSLGMKEDAARALVENPDNLTDRQVGALLQMALEKRGMYPGSLVSLVSPASPASPETPETPVLEMVTSSSGNFESGP